jgi:hypothetical protein
MLDKVTNELKTTAVAISAPNMETAVIELEFTAPYVGNKMSQRNIRKMREAQEAGQQARSKKKREPKKFENLHIEACHISEDGWYGIPASAFRAALIDTCRLVGYHMTKAKMSIFVEPDGFDKDDGQPLVRIIGGEPRALEMTVRLANGSTDIAVRPQWMKAKVKLRVRWDADQFSAADVSNLVMRAGMQVGVGAGRPFSKDSVGMGWGTWTSGKVADGGHRAPREDRKKAA